MQLLGHQKSTTLCDGFWMGKAKEMEITSIDKSSSISLAESSDGSGGVEVAIVLKRASKGNLECVFNNGLQLS